MTDEGESGAKAPSGSPDEPSPRDERPTTEDPTRTGAANTEAANDGPANDGPANTEFANDGPGAAVGSALPDDRSTTAAAGDAAVGEPAASVAADQPPGDETRRQRRKRERAAKPKRKAPWWELPALIGLAIIIAIVVKTFVVQPFYIPSDSMEKTLHGCPGCSGDRILVNKPIYDLRDPHPGDIVVFHAPKGWDNEPTSKPPSNPVLRTIRGFGQLVGFVPPDGQILVKRVIATGGQTVKGTTNGDVMVSNDGPHGHFRTLKEPFVFIDNPSSVPAFGPVTVPKGRLWVMGDHRSDSEDSRYHCARGQDGPPTPGQTCDPVYSTAPVSDVIGKAFVIAWPPSRWRTLGTPSTFTAAATAAGPATPGVAAMLTVLPIFALRRRRRRRPRRRERAGPHPRS